MLNCDDLQSRVTFSPTHALKRTRRAIDFLGEVTVKRLLAFALFLMGGKKNQIAELLEMPAGTLFRLLTRIDRDGLGPLEDRRRSTSQFLPPSVPEIRDPAVRIEQGQLVIDFGIGERIVTLPAENQLQAKTFLLTLVENNIVGTAQVAEILGYTPQHTAQLTRSLTDGDVYELLDKRQGQKKDYRFTPDVKAELIQQCAVDVIVGGTTSGRLLARELQDRCHLKLSERAICYHLVELGLRGIEKSLPKLLAEVKKTSSQS